MVTMGSSVEQGSAADPPKGAARAAERRGCEVPVEHGERGAGESTGDASGVAVEPRPRGRWRDRVHTTLDLIRANPTGRIALKISIAVAGAIVVTVGIALIPLPGPGWLIVIGGLGIWALEFIWARRLLTFTRRNVQAWTRWVLRRSLPVRFLLGAVGLVFVAVVLWLSLKYSLGIDVVARALHYLATH
ncbi:TIGR02611 family protein [Micromonospora sp. NPDC093277]|uniref:TIGR02611 family protein n=1 Tax=Micromonospora sp. NPDC093277 TaxID=3364291 RepID=UPI00382F5885